MSEENLSPSLMEADVVIITFFQKLALLYILLIFCEFSE
jgi:hypothetical protein